jgi:single-strand DNA-binding protein
MRHFGRRISRAQSEAALALYAPLTPLVKREVHNMRGYAKVTIVGNLGADPEMRYTPNGDAVADLRVAVNTRARDGEEMVDRVNWFNVSTWGQVAENAAQYLKKGSPVLVQGRFYAREYEAKDGSIKTSLDLRADDVLYLSAPSSDEGEAKAPVKAPARQYERPAPRKR